MTSADIEPRVGPGIAPAGEPRPSSQAYRALRATIFQTPSADLEALVERIAAVYGTINVAQVASVDSDDDLVTEGSPDDRLAEDEGPELLGADGEEYERDPDGDPSEEAADDGSPLLAPQPDLAFVREGLEVGVELSDALPFIVAGGTGDRGWARAMQAALDERARHLLALGRLIVRTQADFFEAPPEKAVGALIPMTQRSAAQELGLDATTLQRLIKGKLVAVPHAGAVVPLTLFFSSSGARPGRARGAGLRLETLASHIARLERRAGRRLSAARVRRQLESEGVLPTSRDPKDRGSAERRIRRARERLDG